MHKVYTPTSLAAFLVTFLTTISIIVECSVTSLYILPAIVKGNHSPDRK
jgi:hypothetical protein